MSKFQIASDLHIEYRNDEVPDPLTYITPSADVLILAGDIGSFYKCDQLHAFLTKLCIHFKIVIYVIGNCEYYRTNNYKQRRMSDLYSNFAQIEKSIPNLYILDKNCIQIDDVCIVGCTMWSNPEIVIPNFIVRIHEMNTENYYHRHLSELSYIMNTIEYCKEKNKKLVVVTHHCPTYTVFNYTENKSKRLGDKYVSLYANKLDDILKKENVDVWICGHVHINFDFVTEGGTRIVGNQLGKPRDKITDYKKDYVIEV
jgi:predicted phosphodiesterase